MILKKSEKIRVVGGSVSFLLKKSNIHFSNFIEYSIIFYVR